MVDTVGFYVQITQEQYNVLISQGILTQRIDRESGCVEFEYTNFRISHSWNYRVQWKVDNKHFVYNPQLKVSQEETGIPYLRFEFSVPKILYGHNLESASVDLMLDACSLVRTMFEKMTGVLIAGPGDWYVYRIDTCANFLFESEDQVRSYIRYLQRLDYPRRLGNLYKDTGLYFASVHNTFKIYCKGNEFKKHDAPRFVNDMERRRLQNSADKILRVEVENKRRLKYVVEKHEQQYKETFTKFMGWVCLEELLYICNFKNELERVMQKFMVGKETRVMRSLEVFKILSQALGIRSARNYYAIYMLLVTQGQNEVKRQVPARTYYKALSVFRENNISVVASDVKKDDAFQEQSEFDSVLGFGFPTDFSLELSEGNKYYQMPIAA